MKWIFTIVLVLFGITFAGDSDDDTLLPFIHIDWAGDEDLWVVKTDSRGGIQWTRTLGIDGLIPVEFHHEQGTCVHETADGSYIVSTSSSLGGIFVCWLIKFNSQGDTLWTRSFSYRLDDVCCVQPTVDGGFLLPVYIDSVMETNPGLAYIEVGGWVPTFAGDTFYRGRTPGLLKLDSEGNNSQIVWKPVPGEDGLIPTIMDLQPTPDSGYIMTGRTYKHLRYDERMSSIGIYGLWLEKLDSQYRTQWKRIYSGPEGRRVEGYCVQPTSGGGYIVFGIWNDKLALIEADSLGDTAWCMKKTYDFGAGNYINQYCLHSLPDNECVLVGNGEVSFLVRAHISGYICWGVIQLCGKRYRYVAPTPDKGFIATGHIYRAVDPSVYTVELSKIHTELLLEKFDSLGNVEWQRSYRDEELLEYVEGNCVRPTSDGGYIVVGSKRYSLPSTW